MRKTLMMTTGLAWLALTGAASAAIVVTAEQGPKDPQYFASLPVLDHNFVVNGDTWSLVSGNAETEKGSVDGQYAVPLGMGSTTYMSVFGGGTEQVVFAKARNSISIYWGSIDPGNVFSAITLGGYTLTGADLSAMMLATDDGSHTSPTSNELITISGLGDFTTATFSSARNSFEFSLVEGVPEPATWAMMALGFAGLGYAAFRRNTKGRALAI
jgi:PEP-CTERM motif